MIAFFPTYARRDPGGRGWRAVVAGMVSRPLPARCRRRRLAVAVLRRILDLDESQLDSPVFRRRAEAFLFQRVAGQRVDVALGDRLRAEARSDRSGHFRVEIDIDDDLATACGVSDPIGGRLVHYTGLARDDDAGDDPPADQPAVGQIHLVEREGLSVISDIDDTVKITNVADRRELLRNTFVREFAPVPGMAEVYRGWQSAGTIFHYVSASPWQLSNCLCGFLAEAGLPAGSMHLKLFSLKDSTPLGRLPSRKRSKRRAIEQIIADFPGRRFLLVGDSSERDPEVYGAVVRRLPDRIAGVAIRRVESRAAPRKVQARLDRLAARLPPDGLCVFTDARDLSARWPV